MPEAGSGEAATPLAHCSCFVFTLILWSRQRRMLRPRGVKWLASYSKTFDKAETRFQVTYPWMDCLLVPCCKNHLPLHFSLKGGTVQFSSVAHSCLSQRLRGLQHTRPPCPSSTPEVYRNTCALGRWCHPTISSSVIPFFSCPQSIFSSTLLNIWCPVKFLLKYCW